MLEKKLPSGAVLKFTLASFEDADELLRVFMAEMKSMSFTADRQMAEVVKDIACIMLSSKDLKAAAWKCLERGRYNELKIDKQTFQTAEARQDYLPALIAVAQENIAPFIKSLSVALSPILGMIADNPS